MAAKKPAKAAKKAPAKRVTANDVAQRLDKVVDSTNAALEDTSEQIAGIQEQQSEILKVVSGLAQTLEQKGTRAIDNPVIISKEDDARGHDLGDAADIDGEDTIDVVDFDATSLPEFAAKINYEAFMNEPVAVHIHETQRDDIAGDTFDIAVNGNSEVFRFGETKVVRRYIVEGLARAKPIHYKNETYRDNNGVDGVRHPASRGLRYPFSVTEDRNKAGAAWLKMVLAQP